MPTGLKFWQIQDDSPTPVDPRKLNLESRLEDWVNEDVGLVSDDLLVIGKQVQTGYGGKIDLLAVDSDANLVVLELKKGQTPREVVAQTLDYASWVYRLGYEDVVAIASKHFGSVKAFEDAFNDKFEGSLPELVNARNRMYIVASSLDSSTERIIEYLSEIHSVDINAATFAYFKTEDDIEWLGRSILLDEEAVESRAGTKGRVRNPTLAEYREIAEGKGVSTLWDRAYEEFDSLSDGRFRKRTSLLFRVRLDGSIGWFLQMYPGDSSAEHGLSIRIHRARLSQYFSSISEQEISEVCGSESGPNFYDDARLERLIELLKQNVPQS